MNQNYLCITIPEDLVCYKKVKEVQNNIETQHDYVSDVRIIKNDVGQIEHVDYYENGDLTKSVLYHGAAIIGYDYYRSGRIYLKEELNNNVVCSKYYYAKDGFIVSEIHYEHNRKGKITSIKKIKNKVEYLVQYGYDELDRVNSRKISVDSEIISDQKYRFDILDRIVEYRDSNQKIVVTKISPKNKLISYTITDKMGNDIGVENLFLEDNYSSTRVAVNGYSTNVIDKNYVDNVMLKKPYTTEEDLDLIISNLLKPAEATKRVDYEDVLNKNTEALIDKNIEYKTLPISIRKRILFNIARSGSILQN